MVPLKSLPNALRYTLHHSQHLTQKFIPDGAVKATKMLEHRPLDWAACVSLARVKFEKYFNHKVLYTVHCIQEMPLWNIN